MSHQGNAAWCLICSEPAFASLDNKLLTSSKCGHRVCKRCLQFHQHRDRNAQALAKSGIASSDATKESNIPGSTAVGAKAARALVNSMQVMICPLCQMVTASTEWCDTEAEDTLFEQEKMIRQRVMAVYNSTRFNFENTPAYNDYLEKREETVYELTFGVDDSRKKELQEELQTTETLNQKQIVECRQKAFHSEQEEIRSIVEREVHSLQRAHPDLFALSEAEGAGVADAGASTSVIGVGGQPKPLQSGLDYNKIAKREPTDKVVLYRACGLSKEKIGERVLQELWGGLELKIGVR